MDWEIDLERDKLETHLSELMRAACDDPQAAALLTLQPPGREGHIEIISGHPYAMIDQTLTGPAAEAAVLHEAGHWLLGHEQEPQAGEYAKAREQDGRTGSRTVGPWERSADRRAQELLKELSVNSLILDSAAVASFLDEDAGQYE